MVWTAAKGNDDMARSDDYARNYSAALTMNAFCIMAGMVYFLDFIIAFRKKQNIERSYEQAYTDGY